MKNKRAQFFALYLVFITLAMCGVVVGLYNIQQNNVQSSLVSPMGVLKEVDNLDIFEREEISLIYSSLDSLEEEFGSDEFLDSFRVNFVEGIMKNEDMKGFIFENLFIGVEVREQDKNQNLIESGIYPEIGSYFDEDQLIFTRPKISKNYLMSVEDKNKINFPINFIFEFEKKYLIKQVDDKFVVSAE